MKRLLAISAIGALLGLAATAAPNGAAKSCCSQAPTAKTADCCKPGADCCKPASDCCKEEVGQMKSKSETKVALATSGDKSVAEKKVNANDCCQPGAACCVPGADCCK